MSLRACIIGHSFVRRLGNDLEREGVGSRRRYSPCSAASQMVMAGLYSRIYIYGNEAYTLEQLESSIRTAARLNPDVVLLNVGSNDITSPRCNVEKLAIDLVAVAKRLQKEYRVKYVAILGIAPRTKWKCKHVSVDMFDERAYRLNELLKASVKHTQGIVYAAMKGFHHDQEGNPLPVNTWSDDGIHPAADGEKREMGMLKYRKLIRRCLLNGSGYCLKKTKNSGESFP